MAEAKSTTKQMLKKKKPVTKKKAVPIGPTATLVSAPEVSVTLAKVAEGIASMEYDEAKVNLTSLLSDEGITDFRLGALLALYQGNPEWWGSHETFKGFVTTDLNLHYRKVMYMIEIYNGLIANGIEWATVEAIGWTKLKELIKILTKENVDEWVAKAKVMTVLQLQAAIKAYKKEQAGDEPEAEPSGVTTMTFKVHEDQKEQINMALDKGKIELATEVNTVALEGICTAYLGGAVTVPLPSLESVIKSVTAQAALEAVEGVYPGSVSTLQASEPILPLEEYLKVLDPQDVLNAFEANWPEIELTLTLG